MLPRTLLAAALALTCSLIQSTALAQTEPVPTAAPAVTPAPAPAPAETTAPAASPPTLSPPPPPSAPPPAGPVYQVPAPSGPVNNTPYHPSYPPPAPRLSRGMMISGISILGGSYGVSLLIGLAAASADSDDCSDCAEVGPPLFLPLIGPFIAAGAADEGGGFFAGLGIVQIVGAGLTIGGVIKYRNSKQRAREQGYIVELEHGRSLAFDLSTSPRLTGPQFKLSF